MIRIRAKIKVRYTVLLCVSVCFGLYAIHRTGICCNGLLRQSGSKSSDNFPKLDVIRRSFTAKWHDSRELLGDESETAKRARMVRKFLRRSHHSIVDDHPVIAMDDKPGGIKMEANEEEILQNSDIENPKELEENIIDEDVVEENDEEETTAFYTATEPAVLRGNVDNLEDNIPDKIQQRWEENRYPEEEQQPFGLKENSEEDKELKGSLMHLDRNEKAGKSVQKRRYRDETNPNNSEDEAIPNFQEIPQIRPSRERQNEPAVKNWAAMENLQGHTPNDVNNIDYEVVPENHKEEDIKDNEGGEEQKVEEAEEEDNEDGDVIDDPMKSSNKTIFDPEDKIITYHVLHDRNSFMRSQINKSRSADMERSSEFPMTPEEAMRRFRDQLPSWEQFEIFHYPKIWYLGLGANKTQIRSNTTNNFGFDYDGGTDEEGHYRVVVGDHIGYRYEIIKFLGSGTFGSVVLARDWSNPMANNVALKIMHYDENEKYIKREINIMKFIEENAANRDYFSRMVASFQFRNHKCLVLELLGKSVHRHHIDPVRDMKLFRRFATDILNGMKYLAQMNIVHGDLKPDNIMFINGKNNESEGQLLKVADFGIGCIPGSKEFKCPVYYMQTRYYRAPEVILSLNITPQVDMFSVGVIFAEFYLGVPPFFGETEADQLAAIMEVLGLPPTHMIAKSPRKKIYAKAICYETENGFHRKPYRKPLTKVLRGMDPALFDLIARCLEFDPKHRITPEAALRHPFITGSVPAVGLVPSLAIKRLLGDV